MDEYRRYYSGTSCSGHLDAGKELDLKRYTYYHAPKGALLDLIHLPLGTLAAMKTASIDKEKEIYDKLCAATDEWEAQAQETGRLDAAVAYLRTPAVAHTSNAWVEDQYGRHERSNMVYSMTWRVYEHTERDKTSKKSIATSWELTWDVFFNTTRNPDDSSSGRQLAGQDRKRFTDKAAMEKYLQGRIEAYAHLFNQLSPPIPEKHQGRFCVKGELLPGYTVEAHTPTVSELLDLLGDEDIPAGETITVVGLAQKAPVTPPQKNRTRDR